MNIFDFIADISSTIIWPIIVLIVFFNLKKPVSALIGRLKKAGSKSLEFEFSPSNQISDHQSVTANPLVNNVSVENFEQIITGYDSETIDFIDNIIESETKLRSISSQEDQNKLLFNYSRILLIVLNFNRIHYLIFGSQLDLLKHLEINGTKTKLELKLFYDYAKEEYPRAYKNYDYNNYLYFLENSKLIYYTEDNYVHLSKIGFDFLKYIYNLGLSTNKAL